VVTGWGQHLGCIYINKNFKRKQQQQQKKQKKKKKEILHCQWHSEHSHFRCRNMPVIHEKTVTQTYS
jgi:hypothetical protein